LGWWSIRDKPNVLVLTYEMMIKEPENCVRKLAKLIDVNLTQEELNKVVTCMDKKWALENIDPYLSSGIQTSYSPPFNGSSRSGFIVDVSTVKEKLTKDQETEIKLVNTERIQAIIADTGNPTAAANALSYFSENREYFTK
jgi:oligoribonuclease NrnB/cAMP/cGMP phosphodiesterase (DHH superfamily)